MRYTSLLTIAGITGLVLAAPGPSLSKRASSFVCMKCNHCDATRYLTESSIGFGANEAGAEFGSGNIPGELGTDYIWPSTSTIQTLRNAGMNIFRIPFAMERLVPGTLTSSADATYLASLKSVCIYKMSPSMGETILTPILQQTVNYITSNGGYAVVDPHNFGR